MVNDYRDLLVKNALFLRDVLHLVANVLTVTG